MGNCDTCKYVFYPQDTRRFGCRRYPLHVQTSRIVDGHPSQFGCGEYTPKDELENKSKSTARKVTE